METETDQLPGNHPKEGVPSAPVAYDVYFIYCAGRVKIGRSINVPERFCQIITGAPYRPHLLFQVPGTLSAERMLHKRFAQDRSHGEWFRLSRALRQYIGRRLSLEGRAAFAAAEKDFLADFNQPPDIEPRRKWGRPRKECSHGKPWVPMCKTCVRERDLKILSALENSHHG